MSLHVLLMGVVGVAAAVLVFGCLVWLIAELDHLFYPKEPPVSRHPFMSEDDPRRTHGN